MMLSNADIIAARDAEQLEILPFVKEYLQPASYDVHLGSKILVPQQSYLHGTYVDPLSTPSLLFESEIPDRDGPQMYMAPGDKLLAHTEEVLNLHDLSIAADIAGNSSLGRLWLFVHVTAGFIDPGWHGQLTLELYNASPWYIRIWAGMRIAQIRFYKLNTPATKAYSMERSHYQKSMGPVASKYHE